MKRFLFFSLFLCLFLSAAATSSQLFSVSNSHINKILQDRYGYIWIASDDGLTRFDGSNAKTFRRSAGSPSLLNNIVLAVMEDSSGDLWIGTYDGIQRFDRRTETFITPRLNYPGVPEFSYVNSIIEDSNGNIWFTTSRSGLICFTAGDRRPVCYHTTNSRICSDKTTVVYEDKFGNIWIGTNGQGISVLNPANGTMTHYRHDASDPTSLSGNTIFSIAQSNDGTIYVATLDGTVDSFDYPTHRFRRNAIPLNAKAFILRNDPQRNVMYIGTEGGGAMIYDYVGNRLSTLDAQVEGVDASSAKVHDIMRDRHGNIWAALYQKGMLMVSDEAGDFRNYGFNPFHPSRSIGTDPVLSIIKSSSGELWIATDGDGIYKERGADTGIFTHFRDNEVETNTVMTIFEDSRGNIWAGSYMGGLSKYDSSAGRFVRVALPPNPDGVPLGDVNTIAEDASGRLWIGTNVNGICIYNPENGNVEYLVHRSNGDARTQICGNAIHAICFDHNGDAWIGSSDAGLSHLITSQGVFEQFNLANRRLGNNCVYSITEDNSGSIYVATAAGLSVISEGKTTVYEEAHGLRSPVLYSVLQGSDGYLWLSGADGILRFDKNRNIFLPGVSSERRDGREFKRGASYRDTSGRLYFGGVGGVVSFIPDNMFGNRSIDSVYFSELTYHSKNDNGYEEQICIPLSSDSTSVILSADEATAITLGFGAIEFNHAGDIRYEVEIKHNGETQAIPVGGVFQWLSTS